MKTLILSIVLLGHILLSLYYWIVDKYAWVRVVSFRTMYVPFMVAVSYRLSQLNIIMRRKYILINISFQNNSMVDVQMDGNLLYIFYKLQSNGLRPYIKSAIVFKGFLRRFDHFVRSKMRPRIIGIDSLRGNVNLYFPDRCWDEKCYRSRCIFWTNAIIWK